jgi:hypothetical protein
MRPLLLSTASWGGDALREHQPVPGAPCRLASKQQRSRGGDQTAGRQRGGKGPEGLVAAAAAGDGGRGWMTLGRCSWVLPCARFVGVRGALTSGVTEVYINPTTVQRPYTSCRALGLALLLWGRGHTLPFCHQDRLVGAFNQYPSLLCPLSLTHHTFFALT